MNNRTARSIYTVSQLTAQIKDLLEANLPFLWIEGEISNLRQPTSGHLYFTLKDEGAQIRAVMFRLQNRLLPFEPADGLQVICYGRLSVYEPRGEYQIIVEYMEPKGLGALQLAFEQLKEKLAREGLFDPARKKPLPFLPRTIGIVTSPTGAALRDILQILDRRFPNLHLVIYPVRVQGPGAAEEIARAIEDLNQWPGIEVILIGRGGGSLEDLWAFNEEVVARAIFHSRLPILSAVGHEIDFTIADFVADLRAPTPSAAAELIIPNKWDLHQGLRNLEGKLGYALRTHLNQLREQVASLAARLLDPRQRLTDQRLRVDDLTIRLSNALSQTLKRKGELLRLKAEHLFLLHPRRILQEYTQRLDQLQRALLVNLRSNLGILRQRMEGTVGRLQSLSPLAVLERGYSIARLLPAKNIIRQARDLGRGDRVEVKVHRGSFVARVESIEESDPSSGPL
jgi:exodeoxyribonuclease VII large subunit